MTIKNIIFDLGGVLLNLAPDLTDKGFELISGSNDQYNKIFEKLHQLNIFNDLEVGAIDGSTFINTILEHLPAANPQEIRTAWSAMLLDFPTDRLTLLEDLKKDGFRVFLLSNTNSLHLEDFRKIMYDAHQIEDFDSYFEHAYYSHEVGFRKPDSSIFQYVLDHAQLNPKETVFVEDTPDNLLGAEAVGIHPLLHPRNGDIKHTIRTFLQQ